MKNLLFIIQARSATLWRNGARSKNFSNLFRQELWKKWPQNARKHCQAKSLKNNQNYVSGKSNRSMSIAIGQNWNFFFFMSLNAIIWRERSEMHAKHYPVWIWNRNEWLSPFWLICCKQKSYFPKGAPKKFVVI